MKVVYEGFFFPMFYKSLPGNSHNSTMEDATTHSKDVIDLTNESSKAKSYPYPTMPQSSGHQPVNTRFERRFDLF
jgi:hypothetical protein